MTADEVLDVARLAVARVLEVEPEGISRESRFVHDLAADSLAIVEIIELMEQELARRSPVGFRLEDETLDGLVTVGDAVDEALARL